MDLSHLILELKSANAKNEKVVVREVDGLYEVEIGTKTFSQLTKGMLDEAMTKSKDRTILG